MRIRDRLDSLRDSGYQKASQLRRQSLTLEKHAIGEWEAPRDSFDEKGSYHLLGVSNCGTPHGVGIRVQNTKHEGLRPRGREPTR